MHRTLNILSLVFIIRIKLRELCGESASMADPERMSEKRNSENDDPDKTKE